MFGTKKNKTKKGVFYTSPSENSKKTLTFTKKGNKSEEIEISDVENTIIYLSKYPNEKISNLRGTLKQNYEQMVRYVELFHGHKYYNILVDLIEKHFKKYKNSVLPGTIGGYMYGCSVNTNLEKDACSSLCAGSVQIDTDASFCDYPVVIAQFENNQFTFKVQNQTEAKSEVAFVHVSYTSIKTFPGFNENEKNWFNQMGYKRIFLYGSMSTPGTYVNLYVVKDGGDGSVLIKDVKCRVGTVENNNNEISNNRAIVIVVIILIILLLGFFIYRYRNAYYHGDNQKTD